MYVDSLSALPSHSRVRVWWFPIREARASLLSSKSKGGRPILRLITLAFGLALLGWLAGQGGVGKEPQGGGGASTQLYQPSWSK